MGDQYLVKVSDFGTSRLLSQLKERESPATSQQRRPTQWMRRPEAGPAVAESRLTGLVGTPAWMAPELMTSQPYGPAVDVYSFGVVLWELLTRLTPWAHLESSADVQAAVLAGERPDIPSDAPPPYVSVLALCWVTEPAWRPRFADLVISLRRLHDTEKTG